MFKIFEKPIERKRHSLMMLEADLTKDTWVALNSFGSPVTFEQKVIEHEGHKEISYQITLLLSQDEWDSLNRKLGKLGIDEIKSAKAD